MNMDVYPWWRWSVCSC